MNIKILVATHKQYWMPEDSVYMPIHVGREGKADIGYTGDHTGDNISSKNANYCELTGLYWAWKNLDADYIGLVHYRRYFTRKEVRSVEGKKNQILTGPEWEKLLSEYPVVVADKRKYYIESNRSHYNHAHHSDGLDAAEQIIAENIQNIALLSQRFVIAHGRTCSTCLLCAATYLINIASGCSLSWRKSNIASIFPITIHTKRVSMAL